MSKSIIISIVITEFERDYKYEVGSTCRSITYNQTYYEVTLLEGDVVLRIYERAVKSTITQKK